MFEKKRGKRFLASVMALVMLLSLAPVGALAADETPTNEECSTVTQPAVEGGNQLDTKDTNENTPTEPAKDSDSAEATKPEGDEDGLDLDESFSADDADTSNDIAVQNLGSNKSVQEHSITAEYWVTNAKVSVAGSNDMTISQNYNGITEEDGVSVEDLAPEAGTQGDNTAIFWQARVLSYNNYQTEDGGVNQTSKGTEIQKIRYYDGKFQYQAKNSTDWTDFNTWEYWKDQLVFYYLIKTDFAQNIQINVSDWPVTKCPTDRPEYRQLSYKVLVKTADGTETSIDSEDTYYYSGVDISNIQVRMNDLSQYKIDSIEITNPYTNPTVSRNGAGSDFSLNLSEVPAESTVTIKIYVTPYKYTVKYLLDGKPYKATTSYEAGQSVTVESDPTKTGYTFRGWSTSDVDVEISKGKFTMPAKNVELTGSWTANNDVSYTVHYYKQGTTEEVSEDKIVKDQTFNTRVTEEAPTVTGYTVVGIGKETMMLDAYGKEITFYYTQNEPITDTVDAKYFILTPRITAPTDGSSQGVGNYFPNDSDCGGVEGKNTDSGYPGKIKSSLLSDHPTADTQSGYANTTSGIEGKYLEVPAEMGYFSEKNYANGEYTGYNKEKFPSVLKNLVGENQKFDMKNYQIVWYVVKKESNGYHVDGYLKGVSIQLKYIDTFGGTKTEVNSVPNLKSGDKVTIEGKNIITADHTGWTFEGWTTNADGTGKLYKAGDKETLITSTSLYAKWTNTYTVVTHFKDANGTEQENLKQTQENLTGTSGKLLKDLVVKPDLTKIQGTYVHVPSETSYSVNGEDKGTVENATYTEANTVIHQYYYLDETGKTGKDEENKPTDKPDGIPDAWQYKVTFKVSNGKWDNGTTADVVAYVTNKKDDIPCAKGTEGSKATLDGVTIPGAGSQPNSGYRASGNWDATLSATTVITKENTVFTYNYDQKSGGSGGSGGSSRPSTPPTVDIPDDVPTGLNGTDHYAYIIGYGNNDVRPQNNITRAEVATIFFRLLTDETRTANMTKSNSYNDVKDGDWFCCAVSTLSKMGIIKGYEDGSFKPNDPISRAEFAAIAARFDPDGDKTPATFADVTSHWAKDEISIAANHGWIKGYEDGSFKPDQKITRAETMTLVNRVLNRLPETKDDLHKDMKTWVDNMDETAWYYLAVQEATNSHYFKNKTGTKFEQWTDLRDTRDWSELEK